MKHFKIKIKWTILDIAIISFELADRMAQHYGKENIIFLRNKATRKKIKAPRN